VEGAGGGAGEEGQIGRTRCRCRWRGASGGASGGAVEGGPVESRWDTSAAAGGGDHLVTVSDKVVVQMIQVL
jgi:hypothetical protein